MIRGLERWGRLFMRRNGTPAAPHAEALPYPEQAVPFAGTYHIKFQLAPLEFAPEGQPVQWLALSIIGTGQADGLGSGSVYVDQVIDAVRHDAPEEAHVVFTTEEQAALYASGTMRYTIPNGKGRTCVEGTIQIKGGTGRFRAAWGTATIQGILNQLPGTGTVSVNGLLTLG